MAKTATCSVHLLAGSIWPFPLLGYDQPTRGPQLFEILPPGSTVAVLGNAWKSRLFFLYPEPATVSILLGGIRAVPKLVYVARPGNLTCPLRGGPRFASGAKPQQRGA